MIKYVGFDKDGTLVDSQVALAKEWGKIINEDFGINAKGAEEIFGVIAAGEPTMEQLKLTLEKYNVSFPEEKLFAKANEIAIRLGHTIKANPFPEVLGALAKLKEDGFFNFISSSHEQAVVKEDLERTGLIKYIDYYLGVVPSRPEFKKGEPHFRQIANHFGVEYETFIKQTVFIGDTPADVKAANQCGIIGIARMGSVSEDSLFEAGAKFVIPDLSSLPEVLKTL
jgi:phosphoglycolate phosphatase-like HAD superfamily hydrolase